MAFAPRFEQTFKIYCIGRVYEDGKFHSHKPEEMRGGNLSYREAGNKNTTIGYECRKCYRRLAVVDEWPAANAVVLAEIDNTE